MDLDSRFPVAEIGPGENWLKLLPKIGSHAWSRQRDGGYSSAEIFTLCNNGVKNC